jgi:hypothetical protein
LLKKYKEFDALIYVSLNTQKVIWKTMRKLILEFEPNEKAKEGLKSSFENVQSYEILETLKIDIEKGTCVDLIECLMKDDVSIDDIKFIGKNEILNVLKSEGNKHTCLVKYREAEGSREMFKEFDLDLIYTSPTIISNEKITCSAIGDHRNLTRLKQRLARSLTCASKKLHINSMIFFRF